MALLTTTIGAYRKPGYVPFVAARARRRWFGISPTDIA